MGAGDMTAENQMDYKFWKIKLIIKLNMWLTPPKGTTPVNQTSVTDWQIAVRRDIVISITYRQVY